jgi:NTE family protein
MLTFLTPEEMMEMIRQGERATWPKIEAIRSTTKIGRTLDNLLEDYERREMSMALVGMEHDDLSEHQAVAS